MGLHKKSAELISFNARLLWINSPFLIAVALLVALAGFSLDMLSAARAFVGGESLYSKGEKQAAYFLNRYVQTRAEADYRQFQQNIAIPLGDRQARLELTRSEPDLALARQGLIAGQNHPDDVAGMIRLFRRFGTLGPMAQAVDIWTQADARIVELVQLATQIHLHIASDKDVPATVLQPLMQQANATSSALTPLEQAFSTTLGAAARKTQSALLLTMALLALTLVGLAILVSRRMTLNNARVEAALRVSEERLTLAMQGTSDGLWDWNIQTGTVYYSARFFELLGLRPEELPARHDAFVERIHPEDRVMALQMPREHLKLQLVYESEFRLRTGSGEYRWFLSRGLAVRDAQGRSIRMAGSIKDIGSARQAAAAISRHAMQQSLIAEFGQLALQNPKIDELLAKAAAVAAQGLEVEFCRVLAFAADERTVVLKGAWGWAPEWLARPGFDAAEEMVDRFIIGEHESVIVDDFSQDPRFKPSPMLAAHGVRSAAEMLICGPQGSYAVFGVYSRDAGRFTQDSVHFLYVIANSVAATLDRKATDEKLSYLAHFDRLTGLPNRTLYLDRLSRSITQAARDQVTVAVLFVDLDRFKMVNDSMGHGAGDKVLLQVARRLQAGVRAGDTVGRMGGDEFTVSLANLSKGEDAGPVAQKLVAALSQPFDVDGQRVYLSASVGVSIYPVDGTEPDTLLKNADTAMYRAKELGRNSYQFYLSRMNEHAAERMKIETQLRGALERGEFLLYYQPKVNLASGVISGFEALLRWQHPERGLVPPAQFIAILEDTGIIVPVGDWVLRSVCAQLVAWRDAGLHPRPVAVNLSARQFNQNSLDAVIGGIVDASGIDPGLLEFELTESLLMDDPDAARETLDNLRARGIRLSIDDFGTGYSSLAYLKRFPLDALKIDRTFIRDVTDDQDDAAITIAIIRLAHSLGLKVVAEGVETEEQLDFVRRHGCDEMQGYYFARPIPAEECTLALERGQRLAPKPQPPPPPQSQSH